MRTLWLILLGTCIGGCTPTAFQLRLRAVNTKAMAINQTIPALVQIYRAEGDRAIAQAPTQQNAETDLAVVRQRWIPVWGLCDIPLQDPTTRCHDGAWPALKDAQDAWQGMLQRQLQGQDPEPKEIETLSRILRMAYCRLRASLPEGISIPTAVQTHCEAPL